MPSRRTLEIAGYAATGIAGALVIWLGSALTILRHASLEAPSTTWLLIAAYTVAMAWALAFLWLYWRRLDEAAREAQKFAWFYGSIAATLLSVPIMLVLRLHDTLLPGHAGPGVYFALGCMFLWIAQGSGFIVVWAGWWAARR
jgi:hypothetical protein